MGMVLVAGNLALDFVGTLNERRHARLETLVRPADLARWFVLAELVDDRPEVSAQQLGEAIGLREALYRVICSVIDGDRLAAADLGLMNDYATRPRPAVTVDPTGRRQRSGSTDQCLAAIAAAAVDLFDRDDGARVRWCADEHCTHPFLDRSRNKQRRWCDMATCGDRAKVRSFRGRRRDGATPTG